MAKKLPAQKEAPVVSPFREWADRPESAAINELAQYIAAGGHLAGFTAKLGLCDYTTLLRWVNADIDRAQMYAHAREDRADVLADEIVAIADEQCTLVNSPDGEDGPVEVVFDSVAVARNKLRVDARKWAASKLKPRVYADKQQIELAGSIALTPDQVDGKLGQLLAKASGKVSENGTSEA